MRRQPKTNAQRISAKGNTTTRTGAGEKSNKARKARQAADAAPEHITLTLTARDARQLRDMAGIVRLAPEELATRRLRSDIEYFNGPGGDGDFLLTGMTYSSRKEAKAVARALGEREGTPLRYAAYKTGEKGDPRAWTVDSRRQPVHADDVRLKARPAMEHSTAPTVEAPRALTMPLSASQADMVAWHQRAKGGTEAWAAERLCAMIDEERALAILRAARERRREIAVGALKEVLLDEENVEVLQAISTSMDRLRSELPEALAPV